MYNKQKILRTQTGCELDQVRSILTIFTWTDGTTYHQRQMVCVIEQGSHEATQDRSEQRVG